MLRTGSAYLFFAKLLYSIVCTVQGEYLSVLIYGLFVYLYGCVSISFLFLVSLFFNYFAPMYSLSLFIVHAGTKFFMDGFCKSLRMELKGSNVR